MRILHITPGVDEKVGGPAHVAVGLCRALARKGLDIALFTTNFSHDGGLDVPLERPIVHKGVNVYFFPISRPRWYLYSPELGRALNSIAHQFDLIHIHGIWLYPTAIGCHVARKYRVPYIIRPRGNLEPYALRQGWLKKRIYAWLVERRNLDRATALHFANEQELQGARRFGLRSPAFIVPNGIEPIEAERLWALRGRFRHQHPALVDKKIVLFLGRISPIKGLDRLVWAFREVIRACPDSRLVLAGPDNEGFSNEVRRWLRDAGVMKFVIFTGHLSGDDKIAALVDADVFCLASYQEGQSSALTEALMCGLPAVVTREVKFHELEKYSAGIRTDGRPKELAKGLLALLQDPGLRQRMSVRARQLVLLKYTWDQVADELIGVYEEILRSASF